MLSCTCSCNIVNHPHQARHCLTLLAPQHCCQQAADTGMVAGLVAVQLSSAALELASSSRHPHRAPAHGMS